MSSSQSSSTVTPDELSLFKAAVMQRYRLLNKPHKTSRDADVIALLTLAAVCHCWKDAFSKADDLRRQLKRLFHCLSADNPQLLLTLDQPPTYSECRPRPVEGVVMLEKCFYVIYWKYNKVEVFACEDRCEKSKEIEVEGMKRPFDMVGSSVTSKLYISDWPSRVIWRVDSMTGVSEVFANTEYKYTWLSLVETRLLVTSGDSLLMIDIDSGEEKKKIPLTEVIKKHEVDNTKDKALLAIESNRDSFFVCHRESDKRVVSEIDSEGRVIRVFDTKQQLSCNHLALDSVGRLLVTDWMNKRVVLFDENSKYERILIDDKRLENAKPRKLNYNKYNNRLMVGFLNGCIKIFEY